MNEWILTKFAYALILTTSSLGLVSPAYQVRGVGVYCFRLSVHLSITFSFFAYAFILMTSRWNGFWPNFVYALILTTSNLGLLIIHFHQLVTELQPLNDVRISFPLNILRTNKWVLTKFCICINVNNI